MRVQYSTEFYNLYKKADVRIRGAVDRKIKIFQKNHLNSALNNHELRDEYQGYRSIDVTNDYRAIYEEVKSGNEPIAYFFSSAPMKNSRDKKRQSLSGRSDIIE